MRMSCSRQPSVHTSVSIPSAVSHLAHPCSADLPSDPVGAAIYCRWEELAAPGRSSSGRALAAWPGCRRSTAGARSDHGAGHVPPRGACARNGNGGSWPENDILRWPHWEFRAAGNRLVGRSALHADAASCSRRRRRLLFGSSASTGTEQKSETVDHRETIAVL